MSYYTDLEIGMACQLFMVWCLVTVFLTFIWVTKE